MRLPRRFVGVVVAAAIMCVVLIASQRQSTTVRDAAAESTDNDADGRERIPTSVPPRQVMGHSDGGGLGKGRSLPSQTPLPSAILPTQPKPLTEASPSDADKPKAHTLRWTGGGVTGPSVAAVQAYLDALFERTMVASRRGVCGVAESPRGTDGWQHTQALFRHVFDVLMRNLTAQGMVRDDCWIHLTPQQRAMCLMVAAAAEEGKSNANNDATSQFSIPLHQRRVYLQSYCSTMVPCLQWQRGTFSFALNATFLEQIYTSEVLHHVHGDDENNAAARWLTQNFVMDDASIDEEAKWLFDRVARQEEQLGKNSMLFNDFERAMQADKKGTTYNRTEDTQKALEWARKPSDPSPILQGKHVEFDFKQRIARATSPETGESFSLQHFSPLQVLAILHHKVFAGYHRRKRYGRSNANDTEDRTSDEPFFRPNMNIVVFSGDSMNREFFLRVVFHIRFGLGPPPGNSYLRQTPYHEPSQQHDMIYSVFPTYDQLDLYHSQMSNARSPHTVQAFFQKLKWDVKRWERNTSAGPKPNVALLYVVYFWDPQTDVYRLETVPLHFLLVPTAARHHADILDATFPRNASNAEMFISAERLQQKRLHWHAKVVPLGSNPCEVSIRMPDGAVKVVDVSLKKFGGRLIPRGANAHHAQQALFHQQQAPGICTPERRQTAERIRQNLLRQFHYHFSPKPVVPLRDFGMRIAVHVAGHVFWEHERNPEMMQHYFAMMLATDDTMPTLPNYPRRAMPKDQTEMYIFTNSYQENLQPMLRWLSPFYARSNDDTAAKRLDLNLSDMGLTDGAGGLAEKNALDDEDVAALEAISDGSAATGGGGTEGDAAIAIDRAPQQRNRSSSNNASLLDRLAALAASGAALGKSAGDMLLRGFDLPKETKFNLIKNVRLLAWFERVLSLRRQEVAFYTQQTKHRKALKTSLHFPRHRGQAVLPLGLQELPTPFRFVRYVALLEMGKLQALRFPQGDNRHFSCRYSQVKDRGRFGASFEPFEIRNIIGLGSYANNTARVLCTAPTGGDGVGGGNGTQLPGGQSVEDMVKLFSRQFVRSEERAALWSISGMEAAERSLDAKTAPIMHFHDYKEYGVISHDDDDRCVDDGNWFLAEVMLAKMVLRDSDEMTELQEKDMGI